MRTRLRWIFPVLAVLTLAAATCEPPKKAPPKDVPPGDPCATLPALGLDPFTQDELDTNWGADRTFPTGSVTSVNFGGCDNVAQIGIDSSMANPDNNFLRTEGLKKPPGMGTADNFGTAVQINLFLDPAWQGNAVRAGFWVVGDDEGARDDDFGIVEFTHIEPSDSGDPPITDDHVGWRLWDNDAGWVESTAGFTYGEWVTIRIELDPSAGEYNYFVNGALIGTVGTVGDEGGGTFIREVFINQYNFGTHVFPSLSSDSYTGHWFAGV